LPRKGSTRVGFFGKNGAHPAGRRGKNMESPLFSNISIESLRRKKEALEHELCAPTSWRTCKSTAG
jgi:hypothetical protein